MILFTILFIYQLFHNFEECKWSVKVQETLGGLIAIELLTEAFLICAFISGVVHS